MRALLVYPKFPLTYWGFQYGLPMAGKRAALPPLGLISLAALLPAEWELRLVDLNVAPLRQNDLDWCEVVLTGGMRVQSESIHNVIARAQGSGRFVAVGGPAPTTAPEEYEGADLLFCGEAEERQGEIVQALTERRRGTLAAGQGGFPDVSQVPVPRYDLLDTAQYASMSIQYSRGCPFNCEFCDIIEIFGRKPRVKTTAQVIGELDALYRLGYRGSLFFVDDNFIGNRSAVKKLLPELARWQQARDYPYELYTEASVNLAIDEALIAGMVEAGFSSVFLGIESPSPKALKATQKNQNLAVDLTVAVDRLSRSGLEVMGGFIVGLDEDGPELFDALRAFLEKAPIPLAMVGLLTALPGTALWRRLEKEGRLRHASSGDQFGRPNFKTAMDEEVLLQGYRDLLAYLYSPDAYYDRCEAHLDRAPALPGRRRTKVEEFSIVMRTARDVGIQSQHSRRYWRLLWRSLTEAPRHFPWAIAQAIKGEHMIRYTQEDVLPWLDAALAEMRGEPAPAPQERPVPFVRRWLDRVGELPSAGELERTARRGIRRLARLIPSLGPGPVRVS